MRLFSSQPETDTKDTESFGLKDVSSMSGNSIHEDTLLTQIDEFRKKAEALQNLINDRQDKFNELEETLKVSEGKYAVLQNEMRYNKEVLNDVLEDMKGQLDVFANRIDTSVNNSVTAAVSDVVNDVNSSVSESINSAISTAVKEANEPVMEKIHSENVRLYRNLYDFVKEDYDMDEIEALLNRIIKEKSGPVKVCLIFGILNTVLLVIVMLIQFGIINI